MWTQKRVFLAALGVVLFVTSFVVYAARLGGIDGLPPLPEAFYPKDNPKPLPPPPDGRSVVDTRLEQAFGNECPEIRRPIRIEIQARGLLLAADDFKILDDGRIHLWPLSVAVFGKAIGPDGRTPEINTVRSDVAYLTFEHPIRSLNDIAKEKIIAGEISGNIRVVNNRRTPQRDDDVSLDVSKGPMYYDSKQLKIWTDDFVHVKDGQSQPRATEITGQAMVVDLLPDQPPGKEPVRRKQQGEQVSGVRKVSLKSSVDMHVFVDAKSGFLDARKPPSTAQPPPVPPAPGTAAPLPEKAHLVIKTQGPFEYDLIKEFAQFQLPPGGAEQSSRFPEHVVVTRVHETLGKLDQLVCEKLDLQFRRKADDRAKAVAPTAPKAPPADKSVNLQVESAHATGKSVILVSDGETLEAHGNDFHYDARTRTTTLQGSPMWALKEGNEIQSRQLRIVNTDTGQTAVAEGAGKLSLFDKQKGTRPMHARWSEKLVTSRDGDMDVMHLTGDASFVDDDNGQHLQADVLKVWLKGKDSKPEGARPPAEPKKEAKGPRPHHLIAEGHVRARSREFNILDANRFVVFFTYAESPAPAAQPPAPAPAVPARKTGQPVVEIQKPGSEQKKPLDLTARSVEAHVLRVGDKSQLQKVRSEGAVRVHQDPKLPGEKGVDITGETLQMTSQPEGNLLVVTGDLARLDLDKMQILGPEVNIDQAANKAWVNGIGAMTMESDHDFEGKKLKKPVPLTIHWNRSMYFNGKFAEFHGGIQADQANARLTCQSLQVFFDRPISLRENEPRDGQRARIRNLVCDKAARVEDSVTENDKLLKFYQLAGTAIAFDNEEGTVQASGPGEVRILQRGGTIGIGNEPRPAKPGPNAKDDEPKLTFVSYFARMNGYRKSNLAVFYMNVRVLHLPSDNPRLEIDIDKVIEKLPPGALYIRCDQLKVCSRPQEKGKAMQEMEARGRVSVSSQEFYGQAERLIYDEEKDQVIFDGGDTGMATLFKEKRPGQKPERVEGRKIIYNRRTGQHTGEGIRTIEGSSERN